MAQDVAVLDFGSSKITVLTGERGVNNTITIGGIGECEYAGFSDGEWFEPDQLTYVIGHAVANAETNSRSTIRHLYVGVPGEFTTAVCRDAAINFPRKKRITEADIDALHAQNDEFNNMPDYTLINVQPVYYTLDDERRLIQPLGLSSTRLGGHISYILAENKFISFIGRIMDEIGIESVEYVSSLLAETLFLFDEIKRDRYVLLLDVGYITSSIVLARGDGILFQRTFSLGGGHITGDLATALEISFTKAESLKRKVVLSLNVGEQDVYEVTTRDGTESYPAQMVNEIVTETVARLARTVNKCLAQCEYDYPDYIPLSLTGGGLSYIKGARDVLSKQLGKPVEIVGPPLPQFSRPHLSSSLGLMDMVLNQQSPVRKKGFFARLFGR